MGQQKNQEDLERSELYLIISKDTNLYSIKVRREESYKGATF